MFVRTTEKHNVFEVECPGCESVIEIGVPKQKMNKMVEHDLCGTLFIQKPKTSFFGKPSLEVVYFDRGAGEKTGAATV